MLSTDIVDDTIGLECITVIRGAVAVVVVDGGHEDVSEFENRTILLIRLSRTKDIVEI